MAARRFLYVIASLIALVLLAAVGWSLFQDRLMRAALVPSAPFRPLPDAGAPDYATPSAWLARPDLPADPSRWLPEGTAPAQERPVAVFYVPPTTYLSRTQWNAPLDDKDANDRLNLFASSQASAFTGVGRVWAPRYRQASIGAFLTTDANARAALEFAYRDVLRAWDAFVSAVPADQPILLAGHSQGALHLIHLMRDRIADKPVARRIVAAYAAGWPISTATDLPAMGLPGCARADQAGCVLSWQSFAEPADYGQILGTYDATNGLTGRPRKGTPILCVNPITGTANGAAPAAANKGSLVPREGLGSADLVPARVPARCDASGFLLIGAEPAGFGKFVLPGNNYHVFDYALFWGSIRADAAARTAAFLR